MTEYILDVQPPLGHEIASIVQVAPSAKSAFEETTPLSIAWLQLSFWKQLQEYPILRAPELMGAVDALVHESHRDRPVERAKVGEKGDERLMLSGSSSGCQLREETRLEELLGQVTPPIRSQTQSVRLLSADPF